jgi:hypothetical protein
MTSARLTPVFFHCAVAWKSLAWSIVARLCHYIMFVRFRQQGRRLQASLMQTRRVSGKICNEHIASLGSVGADVSVRERLAFWVKLPERLARLANRVHPNEHAKIYGALHARIPMVMPDEQQALQEANAKGDEQLWEAMRDMGIASVEEHKAVIARAETKIAEAAQRAAESGEQAQAAKDRLDRIRLGESVPGGLGKPFDVERALKAAGWTPSDFRRARLLASLTEAEMKQASAKTCTEVVDAADKAIERVARRIIRARRQAERLRLTDDQRAVLRIVERDLRRPLTEQEQEQFLALEQARALGMV